LQKEAHAMDRIASLLPSATEIVCALGFEDRIVGRSHECDYPPSVTRLPVLTTPKFSPEGPSAEVDRRVRTILSEALSVYQVDADALRRLNPDVIVTQSQCAVCAVSMPDVEQAVAQWLGARPKIVSLAPCRLADLWADMERVAEALGVPERGAELTVRLKARQAAIAKRAATAESHPSVACIEWLDPLMAAGNWMPELIEAAGARDVFGTPGGRSPQIAFEELCESDPDVILIAPCGFDIARSAAELQLLTGRPQWAKLKAVRGAKVFIADGNQYFNRPGPRIAESLEILAELIHPELFDFGHEGAGWRRP
jgi:iron complex transport system substrate-binding protein